MNFADLKHQEETLLFRTYARYPLSVIKAKGSKLWDDQGKQYTDLLAGIAVTSLGHCHPEISAVIKAQADKLIHVSNLFYQEEQLNLAKRILSTAHFDKAFFCNSGAEANEALIKLARRYMQKVKNRDAFEIITLTGAFHGRTLATVAATGQAKFQDGFSPMPQGFKQVEWGNIEALKSAITPQTAGILIEIIQGEGGIRPMPAAYAQAIADLCQEKDILLLIDEVQTGIFRTGKPWAFQHFNLKPHAISCAKALANGLPMGAMLATAEVAQGFATGSHATTFGGGALVAAVADKVLEIMQRDQLDQRAATVSASFQQKIHNLAKSLPANYTKRIETIRGMGLMLGIVLDFPGQTVWQSLLAKGFVLNLTQERVLRLLPALTIDEADLDAFIVALTETLHEVNAA